MPLPVPVSTSSDYKAITSSSVTFDTSMAGSEIWVYCASVGTFIRQSAAGTAASAADGSVYVPAGLPVSLEGALGAKLSAIRESTDGVATLTRAKLLGR